jgi:diaminopimelate epimerase
MKDFIKYQSLGNDFIVFDWYKKPAVFAERLLQAQTWRQSVVQLCNRHHGVGADGVLLLMSNTHLSVPEIFVFNADGSHAQTCLNGLRCIAHHLMNTYHYPASFSIKMGDRHFQCQTGKEIITDLEPVSYKEKAMITTTVGDFEGHVVSVGNPHFIVFQPVELGWLEHHGAHLESHPYFPEKTNVEFVWQDTSVKTGPQRYFMNIYERGCGVTLACSSGAAATTGLLFKQGALVPGQKIEIVMPGGTVTSWVDANGRISLSATAQPVYKGTVLFDIDI